MTAVRLHAFDAAGPVVEATDIPQPVDVEVLVRVHAASVNPIDHKIAQGQFPPVQAKDLPITLGRDLAGTIEACGTRAHDMLSAGDRVMAHIDFDRGAQAAFAVVKAVELVAIPHGVGFAAAGGADDLDFVRDLGADRVIDYKAERFEEAVTGVDLVLDLIGGETGERSLAVIRDGSRLVSMLEPPKEAGGRNVTIAPRWMAEPNAAALGEIADLMAMGAVK